MKLTLGRKTRNRHYPGWWYIEIITSEDVLTVQVKSRRVGLPPLKQEVIKAMK